MKLVLRYFCILFLVFSCALGSQTHFNLPSGKSAKIKFQLIDNIIIIPVELNGVNLSFLLDTGVSQPILFNLVNLDSLQIKNTKRSYLRGLGGNGSIGAIKSTGNFLKIGDAVSVNQDIALIFNSSINFTPKLGVAVHGIIGYDIFKDFVVEINYVSKFVRLYKHSFYKPKFSKKWKTLPITLNNKKPYLDATVKKNERDIDVKLLIDTGGSDALWLFENSVDGIDTSSQLFFEDYLGNGLSGSVYGKRSKISSFTLASYNLKDVNVAYPDSTSINIARNYKERNGSISGNILKRFNMFIDYKNGFVKIKRNKNFKMPFYYNNSGITVEQRGFRVVKKAIGNGSDSFGRQNIDGVQRVDLTFRSQYILKPSFEIVELRPMSSAAIVGLKVGDIIHSINGKKTSEMTLQQVNTLFYDKEGKLIKLKVKRENKTYNFTFELEDVFKQTLNQKKSLQTEDSLNN